MVKDTYWFQHDYNARNDLKIQALLNDHGLAGYGFYFALLEILREQPDYRLKLDRYVYGSIAAQTRSDAKTVRTMLRDCMKKYTDSDGALISTDGENIWSDGLIRRLKGLNESKERRSEAAKKAVNARWNKERGDTNVLQNRTDAIRNDTITEHNITEHNSTEHNSTEENVTEERGAEQQTKEENETFKSGGGGEGEPDPVENYFSERHLDPDAYFGANETTKKDAELLTVYIFKRFTPDRTPTDYDKRKVFCEVIDWRSNGNGEREGFISQNKKDLLLYAFEAAARAGKPGDWRYIDGVMSNHAKRNIASLRDAEDYDFDREERSRFA